MVVELLPLLLLLWFMVAYVRGRSGSSSIERCVLRIARSVGPRPSAVQHDSAPANGRTSDHGFRIRIRTHLYTYLHVCIYVYVRIRIICIFISLYLLLLLTTTCIIV